VKNRNASVIWGPYLMLTCSHVGANTSGAKEKAAAGKSLALCANPRLPRKWAPPWRL